MDMNTIFEAQEYGRVRLHLRPLMDQRHISRNQLAGLIGTRFEVVNKWYSGEVERLDLDVLARICYVLDCQIDDILTYEKQAPAT